MKVAPFHPEENARLDALMRYRVLDSESEKEYDELVALAALICQVPTSLVSLVDDHRQWFKARVGLGACETPRDLAFCAHAILQNDIFIVEDALEDERFAGNPLVTEAPKIRFYAGVPLVTLDGFPIGTLCVIDYKANFLTDDQKKALETLAHQVVQLLELRLKNAILEQQSKTQRKTLTLMSHDIRSVFASLIGISRLMQSRADQIDDEKRAALLKRINSISSQGLNLLDNILSWTKLSQQGVNTRQSKVQISDLITEIHQYFSDEIKEKKIKFSTKCDEKLYLKSDYATFRSALQNVTHNAIKFLEPGGELNITVNQHQENIEISVIDSGIGMSKEKAESLYRSKGFAKSTAGTAGEIGSGIGSSLVRDFIENHHGKISVKSEEGKGSCVKMSLPFVTKQDD